MGHRFGLQERAEPMQQPPACRAVPLHLAAEARLAALPPESADWWAG